MRAMPIMPMEPAKEVRAVLPFLLMRFLSVICYYSLIGITPVYKIGVISGK